MPRLSNTKKTKKPSLSNFENSDWKNDFVQCCETCGQIYPYKKDETEKRMWSYKPKKAASHWCPAEEEASMDRPQTRRKKRI